MAQPSAICNFEHVQLQVNSRPIENILPSNRKFPPCFCAETHAAERSPTPIAEHALARRRAKARPQHNTAKRGAGVHVILLRTETDKRRSLPMTPNPTPAESSAPGLAGRDARPETARPAADAVAKVLAIALVGVLFLWTPPVLSDSVATMDSSSAPQTDGADTRTRAWERTLLLVREAFPEVPQMTTRQLAAIQAHEAPRTSSCSTPGQRPSLMSVICRERCWLVTHAWHSTHLRRTTRNAPLSFTVPWAIAPRDWRRSYVGGASRMCSTSRARCSNGPTRAGRSFAAKRAYTKRIPTTKSGASYSTSDSGQTESMSALCSG